MSQDYFPETMGSLFVINAPSSFTMIWSVIKPWLAKETADKTDVLGKDYKERLLEVVDADSLPSILGGNCRCEEAGGCQYSAVGPWLEGGKDGDLIRRRHPNRWTRVSSSTNHRPKLS
ncbi:hypothetical protein PM082_017426 [Marasmius tenuissimus]|nr:hypothetical protein PM082_017426 [Marasmius tenuissimus]